jgi:hypothetical protein
MTDVELSEIDPQKIFLSDVMTYTWSYKIKETGEMCTKSYPYVRVYYENPNQPLSILMKLITNDGIQSSKKCPHLMLLANSLTKEQSKRISGATYLYDQAFEPFSGFAYGTSHYRMLQEKITDRISELMFEVRKEFFE